MSKLVRNAIIFNAILGLLYVYFSFSLWNTINGRLKDGYGSEWSAWQIGVIPLSNDHIVPVFDLNIPFWIFWVIVACNIYFIIRLQRRKETKQTPSLVPK
jgi:hypothetical protein